MKRVGREKLELSLSVEYFGVLNQRSVEDYGVGIDELAATRPTDAYSCTDTFASDVAGLGAREVRRRDADGASDMWLSDELDGEEAVRGAARKSLDHDPVLVEPVDVVISVFGRPRLRDIIRGSDPAPEQVITFRADPSDFAS